MLKKNAATVFCAMVRSSNGRQAVRETLQYFAKEDTSSGPMPVARESVMTVTRL